MSAQATLKSSFDAVVNGETQLVILGSLPGDMSLERGQYYAKPTNQFWRLIGAVIAHDLLSESYENRLALLLKARIGLWDVIKSARREGSGDNAIRQQRPNSLAQFAASLPNLKALAFNGGRPSAIGRKQLSGPQQFELVTLPSSSAAYCSISFDRKLEVWKELRQVV